METSKEVFFAGQLKILKDIWSAISLLTRLAPFRFRCIFRAVKNHPENFGATAGAKFYLKSFALFFYQNFSVSGTGFYNLLNAFCAVRLVRIIVSRNPFRFLRKSGGFYIFARNIVH